MNAKSLKVLVALSFSILCGIFVGKSLSHAIGIPLGWLTGCVTTFITGLFFYEPAEVMKYLKEAQLTTNVWLESRKNQKKTPERLRELLRKKRIKIARRLAIKTSAANAISTFFDISIFCLGWSLLLYVSFSPIHEDVFIFTIICILFCAISIPLTNLYEICTMRPSYERRFCGDLHLIQHVDCFSRKLGAYRGWQFLTITKEGNPVSVTVRLLYTAYENRFKIIFGAGIFLLEMVKRLNSHERIVIAVFGVTFCLVGLIVDALSPNNFVGPLTGLIGGTIFGTIEQIFYNRISPKIDIWIGDMRTSRSLLQS